MLSGVWDILRSQTLRRILRHLGFDTSRVTAQQLWNLIDYVP